MFINPHRAVRLLLMAFPRNTQPYRAFDSDEDRHRRYRAWGSNDFRAKRKRVQRRRWERDQKKLEAKRRRACR